MKINKPVFESLDIGDNNPSILAFARKEKSFLPFWHFHPEIELTLITEGRGIRFIGDHIQSYEEGDLVLIGSNLPHHWVSQTKGLNTVQGAIVVQFSRDLFKSISELRPVQELLACANFGIHFTDPPRDIQNMMETLLFEPPTLRISKLIEILYSLHQCKEFKILSTSNKFSKMDSQKEQDRINRAISFIVVHLDEQLTVNRMAQECHMVPQAFCRWFRKHTGFSFITFLNKTRIESVCQQLLTTDRQVNSIAYDSGFENVSHFNRVFKKFIGLSPRQFRKGVSPN